jgi:hypothetical protein
MSLLEQSPWWLVPFGLLTLAMLHAMMEFTVSLLVKRPPADRKPVSADELRRRLLTLNKADPPDRLVEGKDCDLEVRMADAASSRRLRLLLDEDRRELRMNQVSRGYFFFLGVRGWLPRIRASAGFHSGPPGHPMADELVRVANRGGWIARPVLWWFEATHRGHRLLERLTPGPLRRWPAGRLWGILFPLAYVLAIGYLVAILGPLDRRQWTLVLGVSAIWWVVWGFLAWMLRGFPASRRI